MHELGVTQRVLEVALDRARQAKATHITALHFEIGEAADVSPDSLALYWPDVSQGTAAEGAQLLFVEADDPFAFRMTAIDVDDCGRSAPGRFRSGP